MEMNKLDIKHLGDKLNVDWKKVRLDELFMGYFVELEHGTDTPNPATNVTSDDPSTTLRIAWRHILEIPNYYTRLYKMEKEAGSEDAVIVKEYGNNQSVMSDEPTQPTNTGAIERGQGSTKTKEVDGIKEQSGYDIKKVNAVEETRDKTPQHENSIRAFEKSFKDIIRKQAPTELPTIDEAIAAMKTPKEVGTPYIPTTSTKKRAPENPIYRAPGKRYIRVYLKPGEKPPRGLEEQVGVHGGRYYVPNIPMKDTTSGARKGKEETATMPERPNNIIAETSPEEVGLDQFIESYKRVTKRLPPEHSEGMKIVLTAGLVDGKFVAQYDPAIDTAYISKLVNNVTSEDMTELYDQTISGRPWIIVLFHMLGHRIMHLKDYGARWEKAAKTANGAITRFARKSTHERLAEAYIYYLRNRRYLIEHDPVAADFLLDNIFIENPNPPMMIGKAETQLELEETRTNLPDGSFWIEDANVVKRLFGDMSMPSDYIPEEPELPVREMPVEAPEAPAPTQSHMHYHAREAEMGVPEHRPDITPKQEGMIMPEKPQREKLIGVHKSFDVAKIGLDIKKFVKASVNKIEHEKIETPILENNFLNDRATAVDNVGTGEPKTESRRSPQATETNKMVEYSNTAKTYMDGKK